MVLGVLVVLDVDSVVVGSQFAVLWFDLFDDMYLDMVIECSWDCNGL